MFLMFRVVYFFLTSGSRLNFQLQHTLLSLATLGRLKDASEGVHCRCLNSRHHRPAGRSYVSTVASERGSSGPAKLTLLTLLTLGIVSELPLLLLTRKVRGWRGIYTTEVFYIFFLAIWLSSNKL